MTDATPPIPFHPTPETFVGWPMPPSVPDGMRLELSRSKLLDGAEGEFENWMAMLHERYDECVATLAAERMAFEATFLNKEADGSWWVYHLQLRHEDSPGLRPDNDLDRAHIEFAKRTKQRGWEELKPEFLLVPDAVREAVVRSAEPPVVT